MNLGIGYPVRETPRTARIRSLRESPYRGRPGSEPDTREVLFPPLPYVAVYRVKRSRAARSPRGKLGLA